MRAALEQSVGERVSVLGELEAVLVSGDGPAAPGADRPSIADGDVLQANRLQVTVDLGDASFVTLGRQTVAFDDERFIGTAAFRQNHRSVDAVRVSSTLRDTIGLDAVWIGKVHNAAAGETPLGRRGSDSLLLRTSVQTPAGLATVFHYDLDLEGLDETRDHNTTTGIRLAGERSDADRGIGWEASVARQAQRLADTKSGAMLYARLGVRLTVDRFTAGIRGEYLGAGGEDFAVQTPLGTNHRFNGAADIFLQTPSAGLRDLSSTLALGPINVTKAMGLTVDGSLHEFASADGETFGREIDAGATLAVDGSRFRVEIAHYAADTLGADTTRLWVTWSRRFSD